MVVLAALMRGEHWTAAVETGTSKACFWDWSRQFCVWSKSVPVIDVEQCLIGDSDHPVCHHHAVVTDCEAYSEAEW